MKKYVQIGLQRGIQLLSGGRVYLDWDMVGHMCVVGIHYIEKVEMQVQQCCWCIAVQWVYFAQNLGSTYQSHVVNESEQDFLHIISRTKSRQKFPQFLGNS